MRIYATVHFFTDIEAHSESANLRQRYVNFFPLCSPGGSTIFGGGLPYLAMMIKKFFNPILDPDADPDQHSPAKSD